MAHLCVRFGQVPVGSKVEASLDMEAKFAGGTPACQVRRRKLRARCGAGVPASADGATL